MLEVFMSRRLSVNFERQRGNNFLGRLHLLSNSSWDSRVCCVNMVVVKHERTGGRLAIVKVKAVNLKVANRLAGLCTMDEQ